MSDRITLRGMQFMGRHGVAAEERAEPQPFEVDLVLRLDLSGPAETDDLADTINYSTLFKLAGQVVEGRSFQLLEALAGAIADAVLAAHPVDDVEVRVRKPKAPLPGAFEAVEVRIRRRRGA
ncbi:MAG: dihydroneopterin aldolase [Chloroflexota bacterium]